MEKMFYGKKNKKRTKISWMTYKYSVASFRKK